ncbi:MAG: malate dehydrogenase [Nitrospira bacterium HGW-Nitrospira-1]|nr:MAG: malate dehydrogenase [Nitrospira bacterium HGW-Nitrospira-1]
MKAKVSIIGAGNVGAATAQMIAYAGFADVVLFDIADGVPQGKALDIAEACPLWNSSASVTGTNMYADTAHSDVIVITAGFPRKPGMSRDDLLHANAEVIKNVTFETSKLSPESIIIVVTNPMDVMAQTAWKISGFSAKKVIGMGGILDSARLRTFISIELGVSPEDIEAIVLGGHGDQMVPLPRFTTVKGIPITELLDRNKIDGIMRRTRHGGAEIVSLLKTGSAYYAPAAASVQMVKSIILDEKRTLPCSTYLNGEYGISDLFVGVPVVLGHGGVQRIIELELSDEERKQLNKSALAVQTLVKKAAL